MAIPKIWLLGLIKAGIVSCHTGVKHEDFGFSDMLASFSSLTATTAEEREDRCEVM